MPLNGTGTFAPVEPEFPAIANTTILASDFNAIMNDVSVALSTAIFRDGQSTVIADIPFGGFKITELAAGVLDTDATNFDQVFHNPNFVGTVAVAEGVRITGTVGTIEPATLNINSLGVNFTSDDVHFTITDVLDFVVGQTYFEGSIFDVETTTSVSLEAPTVNLNATSISLIGSTTASLSIDTVAVTPDTTDDSTKIATTAYVQAVILAGAFPPGVGNEHKIVSQEGGTVGWFDAIDVDVINFADGTDATKLFHFVASGITTGQDRALTVPNASTTLVGTDVAQTLTNKTYNADDSLTILQNTAAPTKKARFDLGDITAGQTRVITLADSDIALHTPGMKLLGTFDIGAAVNIWEFDFTGLFTADYTRYVLMLDDITVSGNPLIFCKVHFDLGSGYDITSSYLNYGGGFTSDPLLPNAGANDYHAWSPNAAAAMNITATIVNPLSTNKWKVVNFTSIRNDKLPATTLDQTTTFVSLQKTAALVKMRLTLFSGSGGTPTFTHGFGKLYGYRG